jgi:broad specificity phosphatase PhoE
MKIAYLVHSASTDNKSGIRSGWSDPELTLAGHQQARSLAQVLQAYQFDAILVSDLMRTRQTASAAFPGQAVRIDPRLRELNYGELNGKHRSYFTHPPGWEIRNRYPGGESCLDVQTRVHSLLLALTLENPDLHVAFVSHKYPQLALEVICNGSSWEEAIEQDWRETGSWQPIWEYQFHV